MDMTLHPIAALKKLYLTNQDVDWDGATVDFKVYTRPDTSSADDPRNQPGYYERKTVQLSVVDAILVPSIGALMGLCGADYDEDIAMGNRVDFAYGCPTWYPQMDFEVFGVEQVDTGYSQPIISSDYQPEIANQAECNLSIYSSGRSFHGYGTKLLSLSEWTKYMGRMLLLNNYTRPNVVDARWVGKSLCVGQSYLRVTKSSESYLAMPTFTQEITAYSGVAIQPVVF